MGIGHVLIAPRIQRYSIAEIVIGELLVGTVNIIGLDEPVKIVAGGTVEPAIQRSILLFSAFFFTLPILIFRHFRG